MRKLWGILLSVATLAVGSAYLLSCLSPFVSPAKFWPLTFLMLGFPALAVCMMLITIVWFIRQRAIGFVLLVIFLAGYKNLRSVFAINLPSTFTFEKDSTTLRIVDWNVLHFADNSFAAERPDGIRRQMINFIADAKADVLMLQEFDNIYGPKYFSNIQVLTDTLGFKYFYLSEDIDPKASRRTTNIKVAIFSKYPLQNMQRCPINDEPYSENLLLADMQFGGRIIRLATMHLASLNLGQPPQNSRFYGRVDGDFLLRASRMQKLKFFDGVHGRQADYIKSVLNKSPYPLIVSGDFNSVPGTYAYHTIKGNLQDAFIKQGSGFERSYSGLSPTLRIDFVFVNNDMEVTQYECPKLYLSDHFPVVTDVIWK